MNKINKIKSLGFTLVEMLVVVAVIIVLTGIGSAALSQFNNGQELDSQKEELIADLKLAKNMAKTNQIPVETSGSLKYVRMVLNSGVGISTVAMMADGESENYSSKENKAVNSNNTFGFSVENGRLTDGDGNLTSTPLCLTFYLTSNSANKKYINIDTSGLIYEKSSCP